MTADVVDAPILDDDDPRLRLIEGVEVTGDLNVPIEGVLHQIRHAIRQGHPQARDEALKTDRVVLVGSGPTLNETAGELRDLVFAGAKVVTVNRAYQWCLERNIRPSAHVVLDAKPSTVNFVTPEVPGCLYYVASQCHPDVWSAVREYERVVIYHSMNPDRPEAPMLDAYYGEGHWLPIVGGTTVATRALSLLRHAGYLRFDLFGVDCCWIGDAHHAMEQPENARDRRLRVTVRPSRGEADTQEFWCAPWHLQQFEDVLQVIRVNGKHFLLNVHGRGMLAYALRTGAQVSVSQKES